MVPLLVLLIAGGRDMYVRVVELWMDAASVVVHAGIYTYVYPVIASQS
jgi:hypothetical protein